MSIDAQRSTSVGTVIGPPPSLEEWGPETGDLDESYARQIFFGKSVEQTFPLFARNVIERASELRFMPATCFRYYMLAYRDYLLLDSTLQSDMAPDAASCFLGLVLEKLVCEPTAILPLMPEILPTVRHLELHQDDYEADREIYGNFNEKLREIERLAGCVSQPESL